MRNQTPTHRKGVEKVKNPERQLRTASREGVNRGSNTPLGTPIDEGGNRREKNPESAPPGVKATPSRLGTDSLRKQSLLSQKRRSESSCSALPKRLLATPKQQQQASEEGKMQPKDFAPPTTVAEV